MLFNPMAMMFMMQQHFMSTMMTTTLPQVPIIPPVSLPSIDIKSSTITTSPKKSNGDRIKRFWL